MALLTVKLFALTLTALMLSNTADARTYYGGRGGGFSPMTAPAIRSGFSPGDFVFDLATEVPQVTGTPGVLFQFGNLVSFPVLAIPDTEMSIARLTIQQGFSNSVHLHPRGCEMLYLIKGKLEVFFDKEVGNGKVTNTLTAGQATVFPQGLVHGQKCVSGPCEFVAMLNSADPGAVPGVTVA